MTDLPNSSNPEGDSIVLNFPTLGVQIEKFVSYEYDEQFLTPSDGWHFVLAGETIPDAVQGALSASVPVQLAINGATQSTGRIHKVIRTASRSGGVQITIEGKDVLGPVVDGHVDPSLKFTDSMTLFDVLTTVFASYGLSTFSADNNANLNVITGQKKGHPSRRKGLKSFTIHQLKPYPREGAFSFCARIAQRFGLWIWPSSDGLFIIFGKPDGTDDDGNYTLPPSRGNLVRKLGQPQGQANNILDGGTVTRDMENQPAIIYAGGEGTGGEFAKSRLKSAYVNPAIIADLTKIKARNPHIVPKTFKMASMVDPFLDEYPRPMFLYDDESHTQDQLDAYVRREMSLLLRHAVMCHYPITGHSLQGSPVAVDTILSVDDDVGDLHAPMWVSGRHFSKAAGAQGTTSMLELCLPGCIVL